MGKHAAARDGRWPRLDPGSLYNHRILFISNPPFVATFHDRPKWYTSVLLNGDALGLTEMLSPFAPGGVTPFISKGLGVDRSNDTTGLGLIKKVGTLGSYR